MAAIAYPYVGSPGRRRAGRREGFDSSAGRGHLRLVEPFAGPEGVVPRRATEPSTREVLERRRLAGRRAARRIELRHRRRTRLLPGLATVGLLVGVWFGVGTLAGAGTAGRVVHLPGAQVMGAGQLYVVRPGDTLWSIVSRLEPGADPRPMVDELAAQLHGAPLEAGSTLRLP